MQKIPLLVKLGISGHRHLKRLGDLESIRQHIIAQVRFLKANFSQNIQILLLSPLADGADRIWAELILKHFDEARLIVPIAGSLKQYKSTFTKKSLKEFNRIIKDEKCLELITVAEDRDYMCLSKWVVDHSDFMFFLHDGENFVLKQDQISVEKFSGGTTSTIAYTMFNASKLSNRARASPVSFETWFRNANYEGKSFSYFNTKTGEIINYRHHHLFKNEFLAKLTFDGSGKDLITSISDRFDRESLKAQKHYFRTYSLVLFFAWFSGLSGIANILDFSNSFLAFLEMPYWGFVEFGSLIVIGFLLLFSKRHRILHNWLSSRYLAERTRIATFMFRFGKNYASILTIDEDDSAQKDLIDIWQSISYHLKQRQPSSTTLPNEQLFAENELLCDQLHWHQNKVEFHLKKQKRLQFLKNFSFILAVPAIFAAAIPIKDIPLSALLNFASTFLTLTTAFLAAKIAQRDHMKLSAYYHEAAEQLKSLIRDMYHRENRDEVLQQFLLKVRTTLMRTVQSFMNVMKLKDPDVI